MDHADGMADILRIIRDDDELIAAAYLFAVRDCIHDADNWIEKTFGKNVLSMVRDLENLMKVSNRARSGSKEASATYQSEALRRMLLAMCHDLRVVILRLASRLQTLRWFAKTGAAGAADYGRETLALYSPLANRLGIWQMKWELEDLSLRFVEPRIYAEIAHELDESREQRLDFMQHCVEKIKMLLKANGIEAEVSGRPKHIYSIYKKMQRKHLRFDQLFDIRAMRIIVDTVERCYEVLSLVHENFTVLSKEYDDYIAHPKPNGYQSLHTVVTDPSGKPVEIQIRTRAMHQFAELGVAAHWRYKGVNQGGQTSEAWLGRLREVLEETGIHVKLGIAAAARRSTGPWCRSIISSRQDRRWRSLPAKPAGLHATGSIRNWALRSAPAPAPKCASGSMLKRWPSRCRPDEKSLTRSLRGWAKQLSSLRILPSV